MTLEQQWQEDFKQFGELAYLMWRYFGYKAKSEGGKETGWHDATSNSFLNLGMPIARKQSAALPFDLVAARGGDEVEVLIHGDWIKFDYQNFQPVFDCEDDDGDYSFTFPSGLRMKHPRRVDVDYSKFED